MSKEFDKLRKRVERLEAKLHLLELVYGIPISGTNAQFHGKSIADKLKGIPCINSPKPKPKFKAGDRILLKDRRGDFINLPHVVVDIPDSLGCVRVYNKHTGIRFVSTNNCVHITNTVEPKLRIGDMVIVNKATDLHEKTNVPFVGKVEDTWEEPDSHERYILIEDTNGNLNMAREVDCKLIEDAPATETAEEPEQLVEGSRYWLQGYGDLTVVRFSREYDCVWCHERLPWPLSYKFFCQNARLIRTAQPQGDAFVEHTPAVHDANGTVLFIGDEVFAELDGNYIVAEIIYDEQPWVHPIVASSIGHWTKSFEPYQVILKSRKGAV